MDSATSDRTCVQVFAKISAAVSHEIKNTLAIINENAGLLGDLAQMAEESGGVPLARIRAITGTIAKQVDRSNTIMKNLNRFAHSADTCPAHGDLEETLSLVIALTSRQAAMKNVKTTLQCPPNIALSTDLIAFEALVYLILLTLYQKCASGSVLAVEVSEDLPRIVICFMIQEKDKAAGGMYTDEEQQGLADQLHATCRCEEDQIVMAFPAGLGQR